TTCRIFPAAVLFLAFGPALAVPTAQPASVTPRPAPTARAVANPRPRAPRAASAYRAAGAPRRADGADDLLRRQGRAGCVRPRLRQLDRGRGTGRFSRGAALPEFLSES